MANETPPSRGALWRFMVVLAFVFIAQGMSQSGGILGQPLMYFLKESLGWQPDQVTRFLSILIIPWIVKPLYGLLSDYVPILGYRRKPYLLLANTLVTLAYLWIIGLTQPTMILVALFIVGIGMAVSSTIFEAVLVENGNRWKMSGRFLNQQWLWTNLASVAAALGGGWLAQSLVPAKAFHGAALIASIVPLAVVLACWFFLQEERGTVAPKSEPVGAQMRGIFANRMLWLVALFLFVWNIVPAFGTPLYYHMVDHLHFDQRFIGILSAVASVGSVTGAALYSLLAKRITLKWLLYVSAVVGAVSQASYLLLDGHISALVINFAAGAIGTVALVATLAVAAHVTPEKSAAFVYALLMSVINLSGQLASNLGAWLFVHAFQSHLAPLILVATVGTLICAMAVPMLKLGTTSGAKLRKTLLAVEVHPAHTLARKRIS